MAQFLLLIQVINQLRPIIRETVESLNETFPEKGMGESKFHMALDTITAGLNTIDGIEGIVHLITPKIEGMIRNTADAVKKPSLPA